MNRFIENMKIMRNIISLNSVTSFFELLDAKSKWVSLISFRRTILVISYFQIFNFSPKCLKIIKDL